LIRCSVLTLGAASLLAACDPAEHSAGGGERSFKTSASAVVSIGPVTPDRSSPAPDRGAQPFTPPTSTPGSFAAHNCRAIALGHASVAWSASCASSPGECGSSEIQYAQHAYLAPKSGGPPVEIVQPTSLFGGMALDEEHLYWTATGPGRVRQARLDDHRWGGLAASRPSAHPTAIAVDDTHVFWVDEGQLRVGSGPPASITAYGAVIKVPKRGGAPAEIARDLAKPTLLAIDDASVYWTDLDARARRIRRASKDGRDVTTVAETHSADALAVDEGFVYWADGVVVRRDVKFHYKLSGDHKLNVLRLYVAHAPDPTDASELEDVGDGRDAGSKAAPTTLHCRTPVRERSRLFTRRERSGSSIIMVSSTVTRRRENP
jgi:hypothetical protein